MAAESKLREEARRFLDGDHSMDAAARIEAVLLRYFDGTDLYEFLTEPLALYRPGEGTPYIDEVELAEELQRALANLDARPAG